MKVTERMLIVCLMIIPSMVFMINCSSQQSEGNDRTGSENGFDFRKAPSSLTISLTPSIESGQIVKEDKELDRILSEYIGIPVKTKVIPSYLAAVQGFVSGQIDCGMVHPLGYVIGKNENFPLEVILKVKRDGATEYNSQIIVHVDSGINTLDDLKGSTFAFVDHTSTSGYLYPRDILERNGIDPCRDFKDKPVYSGSHDKAALDVLNGLVDAAATFQDVRERLSVRYPDIMEKTKVIAVAGPIPNQLFCVQPHFDNDFKIYLTEKLIEISKGVEINGEIIQPLYDYDRIEELVLADDSDYNPVRDVISNLDIDLLKEAAKSKN